jgi:hypothetical protein
MAELSTSFAATSGGMIAQIEFLKKWVRNAVAGQHHTFLLFNGKVMSS